MIFFLGDSFTWGQGLYFEKWHEDGISSDYMANHMPDIFPHECLSYEDNKIRKELHFPNLVSKHFNRDYVTDWYNGGTNYDLLRYIPLIKGSPIQDLVVVQFTAPNRIHEPLISNTLFSDAIRSRKDLPNGLRDEINESYKSRNVESFIEETKRDVDLKEIYDLAYEQIYLIDKFISHRSKHNIGWIGFSWWPEMCDEIIQYAKLKKELIARTGGFDKEKLSKKELNNLKLKRKIKGCPDEHLSSDGHKVVADSIINKITKDKYLKNIRTKK